FRNLGINFHGIYLKLWGNGKGRGNGSARSQTQSQHSMGGNNRGAKGKVIGIVAGPDCADFARSLGIGRMIQDKPAKIVLMHHGNPVVSGFGSPENGGSKSVVWREERANSRQANCGGGNASGDETGCTYKQGYGAQDLKSHPRAEVRNEIKSGNEDSSDAAGRGERIHFSGGDPDMFRAGEEADNE